MSLSAALYLKIFCYGKAARDRFASSLVFRSCWYFLKNEKTKLFETGGKSALGRGRTLLADRFFDGDFGGFCVLYRDTHPAGVRLPTEIKCNGKR